MLEQKQRQFWNRQRIPNKSVILDFLSQFFVISGLLTKMWCFSIQFLYTNRKRHVNRKRGRNSKIGNDTFVRNSSMISKLFLFLF